MSVRLDDPGTFSSGLPHACFRFLRDGAPAFWHHVGGDNGFWAVTRHEHVLHVLKDPAAFSSERGMMLRVRGAGDPAAGKMLVVTDPPRHGRLRNVVSAGLTPSRIRVMAPVVRSTADRLVTQFIREGGGDFVATVATPLALGVICNLLAIPDDDRSDLSRLTDAAFGAEDEDYAMGDSAAETVKHANLGLLRYLGDLLRVRRARPGPDLLSSLCAAEMAGERLTDTEIVFNCFNLLIGGQTTRHAASGGVLALIEHPHESRKLLDSPDAMSAAVDELLRWASPSLHVLRTATRDVVIGDRRVRCGDSVTAWLAAANFDERQHAAPHVFSVRRAPNRHLAFGSGPHQCLGAPLARLELASLVQAVLPLLTRLRVEGRLEYLRSNFTHALKRLDLWVT